MKFTHLSGKPAVLLILVVALTAAWITPVGAQSIGMVADSVKRSVTVFDADRDVYLGVVPLPSGYFGDCAITPDLTLGFVTDSLARIWVVDLTVSPPALATGINPIRIGNKGEDLAIAPETGLLLVSAGGAIQPLSVIDIETRTQIATFSFGFDHNSVEVASDGSVLATSYLRGLVHRGTLAGRSAPIATPETLSIRVPNNVATAPDGRSGAVIARDTREIRSFTIPGLTLGSIRYASGDFGISCAVHPAGDRLYVRSGRRGQGYVDVFGLEAATGRLSAAPLLKIPIAPTVTAFGMDQMTVHPDGTRLYVPQPGGLHVYDADTGAFLKSITGYIVKPLGVTVARVDKVEVPVDIKPFSERNRINPAARGKLLLAILSTETFDALSVDPATVTVAGAPIVRRRNGQPLTAAWDVSRDGRKDLVMLVSIPALGITEATTELVVEGKTFADRTIFGRDAISVVERGKKPWKHGRCQRHSKAHKHHSKAHKSKH